MYKDCSHNVTTAQFIFPAKALILIVIAQSPNCAICSKCNFVQTSWINLWQSIKNHYMHLYKSLGILLKENDKLKNAIVLYLRKNRNNVKSTIVSKGSKVILNDSPSNFSRNTSTLCKMKNDRTILFVSNLCFDQIITNYRTILFVSKLCFRGK